MDDFSSRTAWSSAWKPRGGGDDPPLPTVHPTGQSAHRDGRAQCGAHKYAANAFLATNPFANEIANFCEKVGADVDKVRRGIGADTRIGPRFLFPGIGWRQLLPRDVQALHRSGRGRTMNLKS